MGLYKETNAFTANTFALYLASDLYCICRTSTACHMPHCFCSDLQSGGSELVQSTSKVRNLLQNLSATKEREAEKLQATLRMKQEECQNVQCIYVQC